MGAPTNGVPPTTQPTAMPTGMTGPVTMPTTMPTAAPTTVPTTAPTTTTPTTPTVVCGNTHGMYEGDEYCILPPPAGQGFQLHVAPFDVPAATEIQACYFFAVPGDPSQEVAIFGANVDETTAATGSFLCLADASAKSFTVPPQILQVLLGARLLEVQTWRA